MADSQAVAQNDQAIAQHALQHHFADMEQQRETATLGMWVFLVTEIMFFGGLFAAYLVYRIIHYTAWQTGSEHMNFFIGTTNTIILLCSSLMVALAVHAAQTGAKKMIVLFLVLTLLMGSAFLGLKALEYYEHYKEGAVPGPWFHLEVQNANEVQLFFFIYFVMTGLHALHVTIGLLVIAFIAYKAWQGHYTPEYHNPVDITGLYWHFVDIVWIFLYPLLYLIAHKHA